MKYLLLTLILILQIQAQTVLRGTLRDTVFTSGDRLTLVVLESGESIQLLYGESFVLPLPEDSTWNICANNGEVEQCYAIARSDENLKNLAGELSNENALEVYSPFIEEKTQDLSKENQIKKSQDLNPLEKEEPVEKLTRLRKLVVSVKKRPKRSLGQSTVSAKNIKRMPGLAEADVVKAIQALPGVVASSDFSSKIYVRGGGADQNLFLFDNAVVYSPVHFFGLFSTFLVEGVDKVDFYKGGFAPEYGNRLSSVVDITTRPGGVAEADTLTWKGSTNISTFASTLNLEGSYGGTQVNLSGRATYLKEVLALMREADLTTIDFDYRFYDLQGSWYQRIDDDHRFSLSAYTGQDKLLFTPITIDWGNTVVPLNYFQRLNEDWQLEQSFAYSLFEQGFELENIQGFENVIRSGAGKSRFIYSGKQKHLWNFGLEYQYIETLFRNKSDIANIDIKDETGFNLTSPFIEDVMELGDYEVKVGVRGNHLSSLDRWSAEPRLSVRYNINPVTKLDFHVGYYEQFINSILFGDFETVNEFYYPAKKEWSQDIPPTNSILFSLGYTRNELWDEWDFIWEGYYKTLNDLIVFDPDSKPDSILSDPSARLGDFFFQGEGYSMGTELSLRRTKGAINGGISYSYGYSIIKESKAIFPAKWDITNSLKIDAGVTWRDKKDALFPVSATDTYFRSSLQIKYATGAPFTETIGYLPTHYIDQAESGQQAGGPNPSFDNNLATVQGGRNESRYPDYFRFDIKAVDYGVENSWNLSWTILNITNRENIFSYAYDTRENPPERTTIPQFPFFPILINFQYYF